MYDNNGHNTTGTDYNNINNNTHNNNNPVSDVIDGVGDIINDGVTEVETIIDDMNNRSRGR